MALYFVGYSSPFMAMVAQIGTSGFTWSTFVNMLLSIFTNPIFLGALGTAAISAFVFKNNNFLSTFIIPIMLIVVVMNIFVIPNTFLLDSSMPVLLKSIVMVVLNSLMVLAGIDFVRG